MPDKELRKLIITALHPEKNGLLINRRIAEGASYEHIIIESLETLLSTSQREARINELQRLPRQEHNRTNMRIYTCIPLQSVNSRLEELIIKGSKGV